LNLPIFTGARGEIAIEKATREKLRAEYLDRLAQTHSDIARLQGDAAIAQTRLVELREHIPQLETMADQARRGYVVGELEALVSISLDAALVTNRIELIDLEQTLWEIRIALDTLLGRELR
jgi:outer membrane protein TolC